MSDDQTDGEREAEVHFQNTLEFAQRVERGGDAAEIWKARTSLNIAAQSRNIAMLIRRVQALEETVNVLLTTQVQNLQQQVALNDGRDS